MLIHLSPAARAEILRLQRYHSSRPQPPIHLGVQPGGCAGLTYTLEFNPGQSPEPSPNPGNTAVPVVAYDKEGIQICVDPALNAYVGHLTLDYVEDLMGGTFRFENSKASSVCNCGQSFSL